MAIDQTHPFKVYAPLRYSWSGVRLEKGAIYSVRVPAGQTWEDKDIVCGARGWTTAELPWLKEKIIRRFEDDRRVPSANWFELIGSIDDDGDSFFRISDGLAEFKAPESGDFYAFSNDLATTYSNNEGEITVEISRVS